MNFRSPNIKDKELIQSYLKKVKFYGCEYTFANLLMWSEYYNAQFEIIDDVLVLRSNDKHICYMYPCCGKDKLKNIIDKLIIDCENNCIRFMMHNLTQQMTENLNEIYKDKFTFTLDDTVSDYIYHTYDLIELKGKKYSAKRNHINKIIDKNWIYQDITKDNISECLTMNDEWCKLNISEEDESKRAEYFVVQGFLKNFFDLNLKGGLIRLDGKVIAFTIGEEINEDIFVIHVEKAFSNIAGAYPLINREFARINLFNYKYINREEDLGVEGLRKAKRSYYPAFMLDKYIGEYNV